MFSFQTCGRLLVLCIGVCLGHSVYMCFAFFPCIYTNTDVSKYPMCKHGPFVIRWLMFSVGCFFLFLTRRAVYNRFMLYVFNVNNTIQKLCAYEYLKIRITFVTLCAAKKGMTTFDGPIQLVIRHTHVDVTTHGILITNR